jgi:hypothetical protein
MIGHARNYLLEHVKIRKSVELPGLIRIYWSDFGGNRMKVLKMIITTTAGSKISSELKDYIRSMSNTDEKISKPKVAFANIDWTPLLIL